MLGKLFYSVCHIAVIEKWIEILMKLSRLFLQSDRNEMFLQGFFIPVKFNTTAPNPYRIAFRVIIAVCNNYSCFVDL